MVRRFFAGLCLLGSAACGQQDANSDSAAVRSGETAAPDQAQAQSTPSVATLAGDWRVAGINGEPFDEPYGLALSADHTSIWSEPRCKTQERAYRITGTSFKAGPLLPGETSDNCSPEQPARLADVWRAIDAATTIERTPANGVQLSGGGHSLLLFSQ